jgi:hypothetical protein
MAHPPGQSQHRCRCSDCAGPTQWARGRAEARPRPRPSALPLHAVRSPHFVARMERSGMRGGRAAWHQPGFRFAPSGLHLHHVKQPSFFIPGAFLPPGSFLSFSPSSLPIPRARGLAERREASSLELVARVTRDATLARHGTSRATRRPASRRSAVALSAQVPPPSPLPGPARRLHATSRYGRLRCRAFRIRGYQPRSTPHPAPPSGSLLESAPYERDFHRIARVQDVVNI